VVDNLSKAKRSWNMAQVHSKDTKPELLVRKMVFNMGFRYRLQGKVSKKVCDKGFLPGHPDLVFKKFKSVIFVNGCFWHRHLDPSCKLSRFPKSNTEFWEQKFSKNVERDKRVLYELKQMGWRSLIIWECELADIELTKRKIKEFLEEKITYSPSLPDSLKVAESN